jgi:hypothetical protein
MAIWTAQGDLATLGWVCTRSEATMERPIQRLLYWTPRVLGILYAVFIGIFAADVFGEGRGFWQTALALLIHLIPTFLVAAILVVSWRREWIGGAAFIAFGVLYAIWARNRPFFGWSTFLLISGPLLLTGVLFLLNWRYRKELSSAI